MLLTHPLPDLARWTHHFRDTVIPVLPHTPPRLEALREDEDAVSAQALADVVRDDPLMTLKLLAHVSQVRRARRRDDEDGETETVTSAIVWMGVPPLLRAFTDLVTVDDTLGGDVAARDALQACVERAYRAARLAVGFAVHRMDTDVQVIQEAALLHGFAELLLWCHAPALAHEIRRRQQADPALRSAQVQRDVLHIELPDLEQALMQAWRMPRLLIQITDHHRQAHAQVRNVLLAIQLARHTQAGWDNPAVPDDLAAVAELLNLAPGAARALIERIEA